MQAAVAAASDRGYWIPLVQKRDGRSRPPRVWMVAFKLKLLVSAGIVDFAGVSGGPQAR